MVKVEWESCPTGRKVEINMAKLTNDVGHIKNSVESILKKFDEFDDKYARKEDVQRIKNRINQSVGSIIFIFLGIIGFLLRDIFFK